MESAMEWKEEEEVEEVEDREQGGERFSSLAPWFHTAFCVASGAKECPVRV